MVQLVFVSGNGIRRVYVEGRKITLITAEFNYTPFTIDLDKLNNPNISQVIGKSKNPAEADKFIKELSMLKTEEDIIKDIKKDWQRKGWRMVKGVDKL